MLSHRTQGKKNIWPEGNSHTLEEKKIKKRNSFRKKKNKNTRALAGCFPKNLWSGPKDKLYHYKREQWGKVRYTPL